eukprot:TRINITY_DN8234_c0_g2_i2.p1 TRINITY_DN8234_c0_g2~~TRINITY_DN8234_c0_g2_i2.p1  ORF type:complete len:1360 (+),score=498.95 TRINITY_DN8234_c0_g2_i2:313-4392(+)
MGKVAATIAQVKNAAFSSVTKAENRARASEKASEAAVAAAQADAQAKVSQTEKWAAMRKEEQSEQLAQSRMAIAAQAQQHEREMEAEKRETAEGVKAMQRDEDAAARLAIQEAKEEALYNANQRYGATLRKKSEENERKEKHNRREQQVREAQAAKILTVASKEEISAAMAQEQRNELLRAEAEAEAKSTAKKLEEAEARNAELKQQSAEAKGKMSSAESTSKEVAQKANQEAMAAIQQAKANSAEDSAKVKAQETDTKAATRAKSERQAKEKVKALGLSLADEQAMLVKMEAEMAAAEAAHEATQKTEEASAKAARDAKEAAEKAVLQTTLDAARRSLAALKQSRLRITTPHQAKTVDGESCVVPFHYENEPQQGCMRNDAHYEGTAHQGWCPVGQLGAKCFAQGPTHREDAECAAWPKDETGLPTGKWAACAVPPSEHEFDVMDGHRPAAGCSTGAELFKTAARSKEEAEAVCSSQEQCASFAWDQSGELVSVCGVDSVGAAGTLKSAVPTEGWMVGDKKAQLTLASIEAAVLSAQKQANDADTALLIAQSQAAVSNQELKRLRLGESSRDDPVNNTLQESVTRQQAVVNQTLSELRNATNQEHQEEADAQSARQAVDAAEQELQADAEADAAALAHADLVATRAQDASKEAGDALATAGEEAAMLEAEAKRAEANTKELSAKQQDYERQQEQDEAAVEASEAELKKVEEEVAPKGSYSHAVALAEAAHKRLEAAERVENSGKQSMFDALRLHDSKQKASRAAIIHMDTARDAAELAAANGESVGLEKVVSVTLTLSSPLDNVDAESTEASVAALLKIPDDLVSVTSTATRGTDQCQVTLEIVDQVEYGKASILSVVSNGVFEGKTLGNAAVASAGLPEQSQRQATMTKLVLVPISIQCDAPCGTTLDKALIIDQISLILDLPADLVTLKNDTMVTPGRDRSLEPTSLMVELIDTKSPEAGTPSVKQHLTDGALEGKRIGAFKVMSVGAPSEMDHRMLGDLDPESPQGIFESAENKATVAIKELHVAAVNAAAAKKVYENRVMERKAANEEAKEAELKADEALMAQNTKQEAEKAALREAARTQSKLATEQLKRQEILFNLGQKSEAEQTMRAEETTEEAVEIKQAFEKDDSETAERQIKEDGKAEKVAASLQSLDLKDAECLYTKLKIKRQREQILALELEAQKWEQQMQEYQEALATSQKSIDTQNKPEETNKMLGDAAGVSESTMSITALVYQQMRDEMSPTSRRLAATGQRFSASKAFTTLKNMRFDTNGTLLNVPNPLFCEHLCSRNPSCVGFEASAGVHIGPNRCKIVTAAQLALGWHESVSNTISIKKGMNELPFNRLYRFLVDLSLIHI